MSASAVTQAQPDAKPNGRARLPVGAEKRRFVRQLFSDLAPRYDVFNRLSSAGLDGRWRARVVREALDHPGLRVLDVCAGTGDLALACAASPTAPQRVVGVDFAAPMLTRGQRKAARARRRIGWTQGDALALPFGDGSFDRVLMGFSTRNLTDLAQGLGEMIRVLRPGGSVWILETGWPANSLVRWGYRVYLFTVARAIGWLLTGRCWPFTYLARSVRAFVTPAQMVALLEQTGARARYVPLHGGLASLYVGEKVAG